MSSISRLSVNHMLVRLLGIACALAMTPAARASKAELSFSSLRPKVDGFKVNWVARLPFLSAAKPKLSVSYDMEASSQFLKDLSIMGNFQTESVAVDYKLMHDFPGMRSSTSLRVSGRVADTLLSADCDTAARWLLKSVRAETSQELGGTAVTVRPEYLVSANAARLEMSAKLQPCSLRAVLQRGFGRQAKSMVEVVAQRQLQAGRVISGTLGSSRKLELEYADTTLDPGATWTIASTFPLSSGLRSLVRPVLEVKRSWAF